MLDEIVKEMRSRQAALRGVNARVRFALGADTIFVDARKHPVAIEHGASDSGAEADCTIRITPDNLRKLMDGRLNPMLAFTLGQLKVDGSKGVAMKLAQALEE